MPFEIRTLPRRITRQQTGAGFGPLRDAQTSIDPQLQALIGERLRFYYADLLAEPIPKPLVEMLDRFLIAKECRQ